MYCKKLQPKKFLFSCYGFVLLIIHPPIAQTEFLSHLDMSVKTGLLSPQMELSDYIDISPAYGISFLSPYKNRLSASVGMDYSLLDGDRSTRSIHFITSGAGLMYAPSPYWLPSAGLSLNIYFIRSHDIKTDEHLLMDDNESEFGFRPFLLWRIPLQNNYSLQAQISGDVIFSEPELSGLVGIYAGVGYHLW